MVSFLLAPRRGHPGLGSLLGPQDEAPGFPGLGHLSTLEPELGSGTERAPLETHATGQVQFLQSQRVLSPERGQGTGGQIGR